MNGPLEGIKVISCGIFVFAPSAASLLGALGADVIKVEARAGGDNSRGYIDSSPSRTEKTIAIGRNFLFETHNRSKRSMALDLRKEEGRKVIYKILESADVFLHNFTAGTAEQLGVDYETLSKYNPRLIYAHGTGWGLKGPDAHLPAMDFAALQRAGWGHFSTKPGEPPILFGAGLGDRIAATQLTVAILAALLARERHNISQSVETSLFGSLLSVADGLLGYRLMIGEDYPPPIRTEAANPLWNVYRCADDRWICLGMLQADKYWANFCRVIGATQLIDDPAFSSGEARSKNHRALIKILDDIFIKHNLKEWLSMFEGEDLVYAPSQTQSEVVNDPQAIANEYVLDFYDDRYGQGKIIGYPFKFSKTPATIRARSTEFSEHTEEILMEYGYSWEQIADLKNREVIP